MDSKDKIFSAFANRYPSESHKIYFAKRSLRRADWCAEAEPLGQPAEHHYELPVEVARVIYEAGWKDSAGGIAAQEQFPPRWISVKESLPEEGKRVFVIFNGRITVAQLTQREEPWCEAGYFRIWTAHPISPNDPFEAYEWRKVTHWMPMMEMPQEPQGQS